MLGSEGPEAPEGRVMALCSPLSSVPHPGGPGCDREPGAAPPHRPGCSALAICSLPTEISQCRDGPTLGPNAKAELIRAATGHRCCSHRLGAAAGRDPLPPQPVFQGPWPDPGVSPTTHLGRPERVGGRAGSGWPLSPDSGEVLPQPRASHLHPHIQAGPHPPWVSLLLLGASPSSRDSR